MTKIKREYMNLLERDLYSILLFVLFKLKDTNEYSSLSQLTYILDLDNFLKLCQYFGGTTITIPTISEIKELVQAMVLYQLIDVEGITRETAVQSISKQDINVQNVCSIYDKIREVLTNYDFSTR